MYKVKLIKGLSYTGAVHATKKDPYAEVEKKETADALVASGYFELVESTDETGTDANNDGAEDNTKGLDAMTVPELDAYADEKGIDLAGCKNKAEKIAKIKEATDANNDGADYGEDN